MNGEVVNPPAFNAGTYILIFFWSVFNVEISIYLSLITRKSKKATCPFVFFIDFESSERGGFAFARTVFDKWDGEMKINILFYNYLVLNINYYLFIYF